MLDDNRNKKMLACKETASTLVTVSDTDMLPNAELQKEPFGTVHSQKGCQQRKQKMLPQKISRQHSRTNHGRKLTSQNHQRQADKSTLLKLKIFKYS